MIGNVGAVFLFEWKRAFTWPRMVWWAVLAGFPIFIMGLVRFNAVAEATPPMRLFALWARFNFAKDWLSYPGESEVIGSDPATAARLLTMPKGSYFDLMLPVAYSARHFQVPSST